MTTDAPNRHQRRSTTHLARRAGLFDEHNGVSHGTLTNLSFERLEKHLVSNGNVLSSAHRQALYALCGLFTESAQGKRPGRWAFGLPTGTGKTSAIIAWCSTLVNLGLDHISVSVSASKVEALCQLKRDMMEHGVPEERIGLIYADGGRYTLPRTDDNDERQIMLVAHARVMAKTGLAKFNTYRGRSRDLMIWDESLLGSEATSMSVRELRGGLGYLKGAYGDQPTHASLVGYLDRAAQAVDIALTAAREAPRTPTMVSLPLASEEELATYRLLLPRKAAVAATAALLDLVHENLRVVVTSDSGVVQYHVTVPAELRNIIVLDASYPIRALMRADKTISDAETLPQIKRIGVPLAKLKSFENVKLHQMFTGGGRTTLQKDYDLKPWDRKTTKAIIEVVKSVPPEQAVLIFVFKDRPGERTRYREVTLADLQNAGIDTTATVEAIENGKVVQRDRVMVSTWGQETSLNIFSHCAHVILAGVLQRSPLDLAGSFLGQVDDIHAGVSKDLVRDIARSEVCHAAYQAWSRGSCRVMQDGRARPMTGYIIHRDAGIQPMLSEVMPGAVWSEWKSEATIAAPPGIIASLTLKIAEHLRSLPETVRQISTRQLKTDTNLRDTHPNTFTAGLRDAMEHAPWLMSGRSLIRAFPEAT